MEAGQERVSNRVMTFPNVISFTRLAMIPVFVWLFLTAETRAQLIGSFVLLAVIGSTDWVDGFLARRLDQVSVLGKLIDPVADRLAIVAAIVSFVIRDDDLIPLALVTAIVARDLIIAVVFGVLEARGYPRIPVNRTGKAATACIFTGMAFVAGSLITGASFTEIMKTVGVALLAAGAVLYWLAGLLYFREVRALAGKVPV